MKDSDPPELNPVNANPAQATASLDSGHGLEPDYTDNGLLPFKENDKARMYAKLGFMVCIRASFASVRVIVVPAVRQLSAFAEARGNRRAAQAIRAQGQ